MGTRYILTPDGELYHWGIKGMKWGQRRYQNKDGSLTPAGKKRYAQEEAALKEREKTIKNREREAARRAKMDAKKADLDAREIALNSESAKKGKNPSAESTKQQSKSVKDMTDDEIRTAIARKQLEAAYLQYHPQPKPPESFGKKLFDEVVKPAAINAGKKFVESALTKVSNDILKDKVDPNSLAGLEAANKKLAAQIENKLLKKGINPNIKSENLTKWREFNKALKDDEEAAAQTKKDAKAAQKKAKEDAKTAREKQKEEWAERFDRENEAVDADYESVPKVTVEGVGNSRKKTNERRNPDSDPIIIDMETDVSNLPAVYTEYGRSYVDSIIYGDDRRGGG